METGDRLYTFDRPIGALEELLDWDMGLGLDHPDFVDVALPFLRHLIELILMLRWVSQIRWICWVWAKLQCENERRPARRAWRPGRLLPARACEQY